ncbi:MAG: glycosyltransferase [Methanoregula sp.]|nr:glycosyltransferase [Methanoregula sp.]
MKIAFLQVRKNSCTDGAESLCWGMHRAGHGCSVIGSDIGGIPEIIMDTENGFLVPETDPESLSEWIVQIFSDKGIMEKFRMNKFIHIRESFSWEKISNNFSNVFD